MVSTKARNKAELSSIFRQRAKDANLNPSVLMDGAFHSEVAVVAEAPGETEVMRETPLIGGSGQVLWRSLTAITGLRRTDVYITNVIKRQLSLGGGNDKAKIGRPEVKAWASLLRWELAQLPNLKYVLLLGNYAVDALLGLGDVGITNWRGSVVEGEIGDRKVYFIVAFNPAYILREPKTEIMFKFDLGKLKRVMAGKWKPYEIEAHYDPSPTEAVAWMDKMHDEKVPVATDIETPNGELACIGLANDDHVGMCINLRTQHTNRFSIPEERSVLLRYQELVADPTIQLIAQNGIFESAWLWFQDRIRIENLWFDTLLAHHTLYPTLPHNLGFLTAQYTDHPYYKDDKKSWREGGDIGKYWEYNVKDCCITRRVSTAQLVELRNANLDDFFFNHVMRLLPHLARMEVMGVKSDMELKRELATIFEQRVGDLLTQFHAAVHEATGEQDYYVNPNSNQQLGRLFFRELRLVGRGTSTNAENRKRMAEHPRTPAPARRMIEILDEYKKAQKFSSTYANMGLDDDGRFRCEYRQFGTQSAPGRLSSAATPWDTGGNLQNQPPAAYPMFVADKGYTLVYFDLSQAEARYVGWDAAIDKWIEDFEYARENPGKYDCHRALASDMWNIPYDEVPEKDVDSDGERTLRYIAKRCRHGLNYRMQAPRLATTTGLSQSEADTAFRLYHRTSPQVQSWWGAIEREVKSSRTLYNSFGRRLIILERLTPEAMEAIVAFRPQSTIGDKVCRVIYQCETDPRWPRNARMLMNIHDALIALCKEDDHELCLSIMRKYAEEPIMVTSIVDGETRPLIIPAECKVANRKTHWRVITNNRGQHDIELYDEDSGFYRWSDLGAIEVEKAA